MEPRQKSSNVGQVKNNSVKEVAQKQRMGLSYGRGGESGSGVIPRVGAPGRPSPHGRGWRLPAGVSVEAVTVSHSESPCFPPLPSFI